jgi:hypothetical protein
MHAFGGASEAAGLTTATKLCSSDRAFCRAAGLSLRSSLHPRIGASAGLLAIDFGFPPNLFARRSVPL